MPKGASNPLAIVCSSTRTESGSPPAAVEGVEVEVGLGVVVSVGGAGRVCVALGEGGGAVLVGGITAGVALGGTEVGVSCKGVDVAGGVSVGTARGVDVEVGASLGRARVTVVASDVSTSPPSPQAPRPTTIVRIKNIPSINLRSI
jgi:hypothetical protein